MIDRLAFPKNIREEILPAHVRSAKATNAGLWLDKYIAKQQRDEATSRRDLVREVSELPIPEVYNAFFERWKTMLTACNVQTHEARTEGRMIVGLGNESVLETSISLHRTYGVPYIPGSALKGLAASYTHLYLSEDEHWKKEGPYYKVIFGNTKDAGYMTFFDALYVPGYREKTLYPDVITVHHPDYYQDKKEAAPTDRDNPNPIPFLSVTGTYLVALAAPDVSEPDAWIAITFDILGRALRTLGIGAKTSSGYGRMEFLENDLPKDKKKTKRR